MHDSLYNEGLEQFLQQTNVPTNQFLEVGVAETFFKKVDEEKEEAAEVEPPKEPHPSELLSDFLDKPDFYDLRDRISVTFVPGKYEYMMKVCALMVGGIEANFTEKIELSRFMLALSYIESPLSIEDVWLLCEISNLGSKEEDDNKNKQKFVAF